MPAYIRVKGISHPVPVPEDLRNAPMEVINRWALANHDQWLRNDNNDLSDGFADYGADFTDTVGVIGRNVDPEFGQDAHGIAQGIRDGRQGAPRAGVLESFRNLGIGEGFSALADVGERSIGYAAPAIAATVANPYVGGAVGLAGFTGGNVAEQVDSGIAYDDVNATRAFVGAIPQTVLNYTTGIGGMVARSAATRSLPQALTANTFRTLPDLGKRVGVGMLSEGAGETGQEAIQMAQAGFDDNYKMDYGRLGEAGFTGALLGGAMGGVSRSQPAGAQAVDNKIVADVQYQVKKSSKSGEVAALAAEPLQAFINGDTTLMDQLPVEQRTAYATAYGELLDTKGKVMTQEARDHAVERIRQLTEPPATQAVAPEGPRTPNTPEQQAEFNAAQTPQGFEMPEGSYAAAQARAYNRHPDRTRMVTTPDGQTAPTSATPPQEGLPSPAGVREVTGEIYDEPAPAQPPAIPSPEYNTYTPPPALPAPQPSGAPQLPDNSADFNVGPTGTAYPKGQQIPQSVQEDPRNFRSMSDERANVPQGRAPIDMGDPQGEMFPRAMYERGTVDQPAPEVEAPVVNPKQVPMLTPTGKIAKAAIPKAEGIAAVPPQVAPAVPVEKPAPKKTISPKLAAKPKAAPKVETPTPVETPAPVVEKPTAKKPAKPVPEKVIAPKLAAKPKVEAPESVVKPKAEPTPTKAAEKPKNPQKIVEKAPEPEKAPAKKAEATPAPVKVHEDPRKGMDRSDVKSTIADMHKSAKTTYEDVDDALNDANDTELTPETRAKAVKFLEAFAEVRKANKYSRDSKTKGGATAKGVISGLKKILGHRTEALIRDGHITLHDAVPNYVPPDTRAWVENGKVHIVVGNLPASDTHGVLLHELGVHAGGTSSLGNSMHQLLKTRLRNDPARAAIYRKALYAQDRTGSVQDYLAGEPDPLIEEEAYGYYVEHLAAKPNDPLWTRIKTSVRQFLAKLFNLPMGQLDMTTDDILAVVKGAARAWADETPPSNGGGGKKFSRKSNAAKRAEAADRAAHPNRPPASASILERARYNAAHAADSTRAINTNRGELLRQYLLNFQTAAMNSAESAESKIRSQLTHYIDHLDAVWAVGLLDQARNAAQFATEALRYGTVRISSGTKGLHERGTADSANERAAGQAYIEKSDDTVQNVADKIGKLAAKHGLDYDTMSAVSSQYDQLLRAANIRDAAATDEAELKRLVDHAKTMSKLRAGVAKTNSAVDKEIARLNELRHDVARGSKEALALDKEIARVKATRVNEAAAYKVLDKDIRDTMAKSRKLHAAVGEQTGQYVKPFEKALAEYNESKGTNLPMDQYLDLAIADLKRDYPELEALRKDKRAIIRNINKLRYDANLINKERYESNEANEYYTPWHRDLVAEDGGVDITSAKHRAPSKLSGVKDDYSLNKHGSYKEIGDSLENIMLLQNHTIQRALNNLAANGLVRDLEMIGQAEKSKYRRIVDVPAHKAPYTVVITVDGQNELWELADANDRYAFNGPNRAVTKLTKAMQLVMRPMRTFITLDPSFIVAQPIQDAFSSAIATGTANPFGMVRDIMKSMPSLWWETLANKDHVDPMLVKLAHEGGITGRVDYTDGLFESTFRNLGVPPSGFFAGLKSKGADWGRRLERMAAAGDASQRARIYEDTYAANRKKGDSHVEAGLKAMDAANNIINFRKTGASPVFGFLASNIMFFNTQMQSLNVVIKVLQGNAVSPMERKQAYSRFMATGAKLAAIALIYALSTADDDELQAKDDMQRMNNFFIKLPSGEYLRVPVRGEFGFMWKFMTEKLAHAVLRDGKGDATARETAKSLWNGFLGAYAPQVKDPGSLLPSAIKPIAELATNKNFYFDTPIVPESMKDLPSAEQWNHSTGELASIFGRNTGISPVKLDHMLRSYTGGVNIWLNTMAYAMMTQTAPGERREKTVAEMPFIKRFMSTEGGNKWTSELYDLIDEQKGLTKAINKSIAQGRTADAEVYRQKRDKLTLEYARLKGLGAKMATLNAARKDAQNAGDHVRADDIKLDMQSLSLDAYDEE